MYVVYIQVLSDHLLLPLSTLSFHSLLMMFMFLLLFLSSKITAIWQCAYGSQIRDKPRDIQRKWEGSEFWCSVAKKAGNESKLLLRRTELEEVLLKKTSFVFFSLNMGTSKTCIVGIVFWIIVATNASFSKGMTNWPRKFFILLTSMVSPNYPVFLNELNHYTCVRKLYI